MSGHVQPFVRSALRVTRTAAFFLAVAACSRNDGASAAPSPGPTTPGVIAAAPPAAVATPARPVVPAGSRRRDAVVDVVERVSPAVVFVGTKHIVESRFRSRDPFFDEFFGDAFGPRRREVESLGSGVLVSTDGTVITNNHVIRGASEVHVVLADGRKLDAEVVGADPDNDIAVLKIPGASALPAAKLGTSSDLMIGETVVAIGSPFGLQKTVTVGVLSATGRSFRADDQVFVDFLQTDASINPGNSGGPLMNLDGDVVGINTAIYAGGQGIGFAIPVDKVKRIVAELEQFGKVRRAWVGVDVRPISPSLAVQLGWDKNYGVVITDVEPDSPAGKAGIALGDIVGSVGGTPVADDADFRARLKGYPAKSSMAVELFREGKAVRTTVVPVEFPTERAERLSWEGLGFRVKAFRQGQGLVLTEVRAGSPAARAGLAAGDVVLRVNNVALATAAEFREAIVDAREAGNVLLRVRRGRGVYHLTLPFQRR